MPFDDLAERASNGEFEELKQSSTYVGFKRRKGSICYEEPIFNPLKTSKAVARKQVRLVNRLLTDLAKQHIGGVIEMDEDEVNEILSLGMVEVLKSFDI